MNVLTKKRYWGLAVLTAAACVVVGFSHATSSAATKITLTEEDYFNTPGQISALAAYSKQFEAAHPGVTVKRQYVPFANLDTKLLTQAAGHDLPNLLAVDNPFVSTMISTGQVVPLDGLQGFSTKGYFPAVINEGLSGGKHYSLPVAGANSIALIYNIAMLKAANVSPPTTWDQLVADAKALTTPDHYGIALTCEAGEDTTWQWEPFFWSNGGKATFSNVASAPGVQALSLWKQLIDNGSASKDCLNWSQTPAASTQFIDGKAAMMVNGPWNFPTMNQAKLFYGQQFGIVPVPVRVAGQHVVVPLGGEDWMISKSGGTAAQQMAFEYINGMQTPAKGVAAREAVRLSTGQDRRGEDVPEAGRPRVDGLRQPNSVRASTHARLGREVSEDLPGSVDRDPVRLVRFAIRAGRAEHGTRPDYDHSERQIAAFSKANF